MINFCLELIITIKNVILAFLVSWVRFFITPPKKSVKEEIVLVTGAGRGIGREISLHFARLRAHVVLWDKDEKSVEESRQLIEQEGFVCHAYTCDVSDKNQVNSVGEEVKNCVGDVTIVINNAGVVAGKRLVDLSPEDIEATFNTNLFGVIWVVKQFLPSMIENNHGHVVTIASSCGLIGLARLADYSASKGGVIGFTEVLSYEMAFGGYDGVHTTIVCPSFVKTGMFEGCRMQYPHLLNELELTPTVSRIVTGILTNQTHLYIPRLVYIMAALKTVLPTRALNEFLQFCKVDSFMDSFVGRLEDDNSNSCRNGL